MRALIRLVILVLLLPKRVPGLTKFVDFVVQAMGGNARYTNCDPSLADVTSANEALNHAETASKTRAKGTAEVRDEKERELRSLMKKLGGWVQRLADANPAQAEAIIQEAGFQVKRVPSKSRGPFEVRQGKVSGEVILTVRSAGRKASYEWQYSTDQKTWTTLPTTIYVKTTVSGLTPGTRYYFRFRTVTKAGEGDWSSAIDLIVK